MARPAGLEPATAGLAYQLPLSRPPGKLAGVCGLDYLFTISGAARIVSTEPVESLSRSERRAPDGSWWPLPSSRPSPPDHSRLPGQLFSWRDAQRHLVSSIYHRQKLVTDGFHGIATGRHKPPLRFPRYGAVHPAGSVSRQGLLLCRKPTGRGAQRPMLYPVELRAPKTSNLVGVAGFEPATYCSQSSCATRLRYTPTV